MNLLACRRCSVCGSWSPQDPASTRCLPRSPWTTTPFLFGGSLTDVRFISTTAASVCTPSAEESGQRRLPGDKLRCRRVSARLRTLPFLSPPPPPLPALTLLLFCRIPERSRGVFLSPISFLSLSPRHTLLSCTLAGFVPLPLLSPAWPSH